MTCFQTRIRFTKSGVQKDSKSLAQVEDFFQTAKDVNSFCNEVKLAFKDEALKIEAENWIMWIYIDTKEVTLFPRKKQTILNIYDVQDISFVYQNATQLISILIRDNNWIYQL